MAVGAHAQEHEVKHGEPVGVLRDDLGSWGGIGVSFGTRRRGGLIEGTGRGED